MKKVLLILLIFTSTYTIACNCRRDINAIKTHYKYSPIVLFVKIIEQDFPFTKENNTNPFISHQIENFNVHKAIVTEIYKGEYFKNDTIYIMTEINSCTSYFNINSHYILFGKEYELVEYENNIRKYNKFKYNIITDMCKGTQLLTTKNRHIINSSLK